MQPNQTTMVVGLIFCIQLETNPFSEATNNDSTFSSRVFSATAIFATQ